MFTVNICVRACVYARVCACTKVTIIYYITLGSILHIDRIVTWGRKSMSTCDSKQNITTPERLGFNTHQMFYGFVSFTAISHQDSAHTVTGMVR